MKILISGPQGSGKSTQARIVAQKLNLCLIKTGHLIREFAALPGDVNSLVKNLLERGEMVDDILVADLIKEKLALDECQDGFVMDGYPRRMSQLQVFDPKFDLVFSLDISNDVARKRLLARGRVDDTALAIEKRIELYHLETEKVLDYYRNKGCLVIVEGILPLDEVTSEIEKIVKQRLAQ
ncbi:MAG: nucleoside monophosphate kinase [Candidatus Daviesbacteria bacterium]|nr:nucleoside monophosphate kinase [Candidatus Daviesbacteria bacterium]